MLSLDTNCVVRWLLWDEPKQANIIEELLTREQVHVSDGALLETAWVLTSVYKCKSVQVAEALLRIIYHPQIQCSTSLFARIANEITRKNGVNFTDVYLVLFSTIKDKSQLVTFDKKLHKAFPKYTVLL